MRLDRALDTSWRPFEGQYCYFGWDREHTGEIKWPVLVFDEAEAAEWLAADTTGRRVWRSRLMEVTEMVMEIPIRPKMVERFEPGSG